MKKLATLLVVALSLVILLIPAAVAAQDETQPLFLLKWGTPGTGDGQFSWPQGVTVDSDGNVYVADAYNERIQKFTSSGNFLTKWGTCDPDEFSFPYGVAVDSDGNVYVSDGVNKRIRKFTSSGTLITEWGTGEYSYPLGIAVDSEGNVYVSDTGNHRIQKFTNEGEYILQWGGTYGSGNGEFKSPRHVAVDSESNVYVSDSYNNRIQKFTSSGTFLTKWGTEGAGDGQFKFPQGIAVDSLDYIYVVEHDGYRVQVFGFLSLESLRSRVEQFYSEGLIDYPDVKDSLIDKLNAVIEKIDKGQEKPAENILNAFINQVRAQADKHIASEAADILISEAEHILSQL